MSRKYLNNRWCVRCGRTEPTPFVKKYGQKTLAACPGQLGNMVIVDIGCGNGRNSQFFRDLSCVTVYGLDMASTSSAVQNASVVLGVDEFPLCEQSVSLFLANYVFMFLSPAERKQVIAEILHTALPGARIMVELYPAKDSYAKTQEACNRLKYQLIRALTNGKKDQLIVDQKDRFICSLK